MIFSSLKPYLAMALLPLMTQCQQSDSKVSNAENQIGFSVDVGEHSQILNSAELIIEPFDNIFSPLRLNALIAFKGNQAYIEFDQSNSQSPIPEGTLIREAKLYLYSHNSQLVFGGIRSQFEFYASQLSFRVSCHAQNLCGQKNYQTVFFDPALEPQTPSPENDMMRDEAGVQTEKASSQSETNISEENESNDESDGLWEGLF